MNTVVRKIYALPGVWQLFTVPVLAANFMMKDLQQRPERPRCGYVLFWALWLAEFISLAIWYAYYFSGNAEKIGAHVSSGAFFATGLAVIVLGLVHTKKHPTAFREFLIEQGFAAHRTELRSAENV